MSTPYLLPDVFVHECTSKPQDILYYLVHVGNADADLVVDTKTRQSVLEDALRVANQLKNAGLSPRPPGQPAANVSILLRSGYNCLLAFLGVTLLRWTPVFLSLRNSHDMNLHLLRESQSRSLIVNGAHSEVATRIKAQLPSILTIDADQVDPHSGILLDLKELSSPTQEEYLVEKECSCYVMHTSGSTGYPKLMPETHARWWEKVGRFAPTPGYVAVSMTPIQHTMGMLHLMAIPWIARRVPLIVETKQPPTGELFCRLLERFPGAMCSAPPSVLEEIAFGDPKQLITLASAHLVVFAGAPLSQKVGDKLVAEGVRLASAYGCTESGLLTVYDRASDDPQDWRYLRFIDPSQLAFVPLAAESDGLHQLVIKPGRFLDPDLANYSDPVGYTPGDLWKPHPTIPDLWKHMGRRGPGTILSNGMKTDNEQLVSLVEPNSVIREVVVFGEGRFQVGIIVLPLKAPWNADDILTTLWPTIEHANTILPQHSRLVRELVLVADPQKGFVLSDKGTVRQKETLQLYQQEIDAAYDELENASAAQGLPAAGDKESALAYIRDVVVRILGKNVDDDQDLFDAGMDSLMALTCRSRLLGLGAVYGHGALLRTVVYRYPTMRSLFDLITSRPSQENHPEVQQILSDLERTWSLVPRVNAHSGTSTAAPSDGNIAVLLTGSTGTFGSQVLTVLLESVRVKVVYCLNRASADGSLEQRQRRNMDKPDVLDAHPDKVKLWVADLRQEDLGLDTNRLSEIRETVTHIVHCAWEVNFNHPTRRFISTHITGVRHLVDLALSSRCLSPPRFIFVSSVSAVANYSGPEDAIPERMYDDPVVCLQQGYAQSKYIAEYLLARASKETGLPVTIVRAADLSGSTNTGRWNSNEVMPIFFRTCYSLAEIPDVIPDARWVPTDVAAQAVRDMLLAPDDTPLVVRHIQNAHVLDGKTLVTWLLDASGGRLKTTSFDAWLQRIQSAGDDVPAKRLLDVFEDWHEKGTDHCRRSLYRPLSLKSTLTASALAAGFPLTKKLITLYWKSSTDSLSSI